MNRKQLVALWIGIVLFVLAGLFPPWSYSQQSYSKDPRFVYGPLINPPVHEEPSTDPRLVHHTVPSLDTHRLLIQWAMIAVLTAGAILTLAERKPRHRE